MIHYVYGLYTSDTNKLFYVGITSGDKNLYFRIKNHCYANEDNPHKTSIIKKHGMTMKILYRLSSRDEAEEREEFLIRFLGDTLTNITSGAKDLSRARKRIKKGTKKRKRTTEENIANRDRNLTLSYENIMELIGEWGRYPQETQKSFAERHGIKRSKFKDWLRLYKPGYIGLQKRLKIYNVAYKRYPKQSIFR